MVSAWPGVGAAGLGFVYAAGQMSVFFTAVKRLHSLVISNINRVGFGQNPLTIPTPV